MGWLPTLPDASSSPLSARLASVEFDMHWNNHQCTQNSSSSFSLFGLRLLLWVFLPFEGYLIMQNAQVRSHSWITSIPSSFIDEMTGSIERPNFFLFHLASYTYYITMAFYHVATTSEVSLQYPLRMLWPSAVVSSGDIGYHSCDDEPHLFILIYRVENR